jgi:serine/threonine protein kinase/Flp pilus assembly protein TadD
MNAAVDRRPECDTDVCDPFGGRAQESQLAVVVEEYLAALEAGQKPDPAEFVARYPDIANELGKCLDGLELVHRVGPQLTSATHSPNVVVADPAGTVATLGDFRIVREIGRGGMGVVYEAEQLSIGRRVALKVLPFAAMLDKQQLNRFKNEARAAGTLDHPNIVAIHSVGVERSVHFYAMQLVEGESLAQVIARLREELEASSEEREAADKFCRDAEVRRSGARPAEEMPNADCGLRNEDVEATVAHNSARRIPHSAFDTQPIAALSTIRAPRSSPLAPHPSEYFRSIARLGVQAAEALDHAHQNGILHRDVKPANLLVDDAGKLWVTDFGLARLETDAGMTMTGDLIGTLRYMSPEQALAKRVVVDHRSDVYSLGATLYELLTLQPPFDGEDRQELLRKIAFEEPKAPRHVNARIPQDLETIVLKAIEKNPTQRYATAAELAADLRRYLDHEPIKAKPLGWRGRAVKWARRHPVGVRAAVASISAAAVIIAIAVGWVLRDRAARQKVAESTAQLALDEATRLIDQQKWPEAAAAIQRAEDVLSESSSEEPVALQAKNLQRDIAMVLKSQEIRNRKFTSSQRVSVASDENPNQFVGTTAPEKSRLYLQWFKEYGIDVASLPVDEAVKRIRTTTIALELALDLDACATILRHTRDPLWTKCSEIARQIDPDPWRCQLRDTLSMDVNDRREALRELAATVGDAGLNPRTASMFASLMFDAGEFNAAIEPLKATQRNFPNDFGANMSLAFALANSEPPQYFESAAYARAAIALRPIDAEAYGQLGLALHRVGRIQDAAEIAAAYRAAMRLDPMMPGPHLNLGLLLDELDQTDDAIANYREEIRLNPKHGTAYLCLGWNLRERGDFEGAADIYDAAISIAADEDARRQFQDRLDEVRALELEAAGGHDELANPELDGPPALVGNALACEGRYGLAARKYVEAAREHPDDSGIAVRAAFLLLASGDRPGYEAMCQQMLGRFGDDDASLVDARRTCWACTISAEVVGDQEAWLPLANRALQDPEAPWLSFRERGFAAYRAGDWEGTLSFCRVSRTVDAVARPENRVSQTINRLLEAMALHRLGRPAEAQSAYDEAIRAAPNKLQGDDWLEWVAYNLIRREAEELLQILSESNALQMTN